jgi:hypothetical protein
VGFFCDRMSSEDSFALVLKELGLICYVGFHALCDIVYPFNRKSEQLAGNQ